MKLIILLMTAILITGCQHNSVGSVNKVSKTGYPLLAPVKKTKCNVVGLNWKSSAGKLKQGLCALSRRYGKVQVTSTCRTRKQNRSVKRSYHLYSRGCKAADIYIKGVSGAKILAWWARHMGGGRGKYACRRFVHVDTGENRTWSWNLCRKRKRKHRGHA